jgi:hypothetical protein
LASVASPERCFTFMGFPPYSNQQDLSDMEGPVLSMRKGRATLPVFLTLAVLALCSLRGHAQAALLLEEPYGLFGTLNPTGHLAIYFERVCAETPVRLRRCAAGESGSVISRYHGIEGYDWLAVPLVPYLYSVERADQVPARVDRPLVTQMRERYREARLQALGDDPPKGNFTREGWDQLVGTAYERRSYAFRFETTPEQDDDFIAQMNDRKNHSHFNLLYNNCADFTRTVLNTYFPGTFKRNLFPDAAMTTPKQITYKLVKYARKHPEVQLTVFEIAQIPGYRRQSHSTKSVAESLTTTPYAVPIALANPYIAGALFVDYLVRGHFHPVPKHPLALEPDNLSALTAPAPAAQNPDGVGIQAPATAAPAFAATRSSYTANSGLKEMKNADE